MIVAFLRLPISAIAIVSILHASGAQGVRTTGDPKGEGIVLATVFGPAGELTAVFYGTAVVLYLLAAFAAGTSAAQPAGRSAL